MFAAYAGALFAAGAVTHGGRLGLGVLLLDHLVIAASFTPNLPLTLETEGIRLRVVSRIVEVSAAGGIWLNPVGLRLGVSWSIDLRSYSVTSLAERIEAQPDGLNRVNALTPFVSVEWGFSDNIGVFGRVGADIALNETVYTITRADHEVEAVVPFVTKLVYCLGLVIRI